MILPDFVLPTRINQCWDYSGIDNPEICRNKKHFLAYPYKFNYVYNSRGFRDHDWPASIMDLQASIWCIGDSFTVGVGSPREHSWTWLLQQATQRRTVNISMDGASNDWIARKSIAVLKNIMPDIMIIHWSYVSRRELDLETAIEESWQRFYHNIKDKSWPTCQRKDMHSLPMHIQQEIECLHGGWCVPVIPDEHRILQYVKCTHEQDIDNTLTNITMVAEANQRTKIIHSFIPGFVPRTLQGQVEAQVPGNVIAELTLLDLARDGHHYDIKTSQSFVEHIMRFLD